MAIEDGVVAGLQPDIAPVLGNAAVASRVVDAIAQALPERRVLGRLAHLVVHEHAIDRKSTRLNSSHLVISYAVFCLKKKKKIPSIKILHCQHLKRGTASSSCNTHAA